MDNDLFNYKDILPDFRLKVTYYDLMTTEQKAQKVLDHFSRIASVMLSITLSSLALPLYFLPNFPEIFQPSKFSTTTLVLLILFSVSFFCFWKFLSINKKKLKLKMLLLDIEQALKITRVSFPDDLK